MAEIRVEQGIAVLWAAHLRDEATDADRVIVLHRGHVLRDASPDALIVGAGVARLEDAMLALTESPQAEVAL